MRNTATSIITMNTMRIMKVAPAVMSIMKAAAADIITNMSITIMSTNTMKAAPVVTSITMSMSTMKAAPVDTAITMSMSTTTAAPAVTTITNTTMNISPAAPAAAVTTTATAIPTARCFCWARRCSPPVCC